MNNFLRERAWDIVLVVAAIVLAAVIYIQPGSAPVCICTDGHNSACEVCK